MLGLNINPQAQYLTAFLKIFFIYGFQGDGCFLKTKTFEKSFFWGTTFRSQNLALGYTVFKLLNYFMFHVLISSNLIFNFNLFLSCFLKNQKLG